jgi:hypothetical protein
VPILAATAENQIGLSQTEFQRPRGLYAWIVTFAVRISHLLPWVSTQSR